MKLREAIQLIEKATGKKVTLKEREYQKELLEEYENQLTNGKEAWREFTKFYNSNSSKIRIELRNKLEDFYDDFNDDLKLIEKEIAKIKKK